MLGLSDGLLTSDIKTRELVAKEFAKIKPSLVITHYSDEIHPDHVETHDIVNKASFLSQLKKFSHDAYPGPKQILYYSLNPKKIINPDLLIDISEVFEIKNRALAVHKSQASVITSLNALATIYGSLSGTQYAEGFKFKEPLIINKTMTLLR